MALSSLTGVNTPMNIPSYDMLTVQTSVLPEEKDRKVSEEKSVNVEAYVRNYFSDIPIMAEIAKCESHFRHFNTAGTVLRGEVNSQDVGVMQINERYHLDHSLNLDLDIHTLEGNVRYARALYEKKGTRPWVHSRPCWSRHIAIQS